MIEEVRHGYRDGLEPGELFALVPSTRAATYELLTELERFGRELRERIGPARGYGMFVGLPAAA